MTFITADDKIIVYNGDTPTVIINDTKFLPLCVCTKVVLLSNYKLYIINKFKLVEINLCSGDDYAIDSYDFTDNYAKINSVYYKIYIGNDNCTPFLIATDFIAKKSQFIIRCLSKYLIIYNYYVDVADNLIQRVNNHLDTINSTICCDTNVDFLLYAYCDRISDYSVIVYKKVNDIICSIYNRTTLIESYTITNMCETIVKRLANFVLDSGGIIHKIMFKANRCVLEKMNAKINDFNICDNNFYYYTTISDNDSELSDSSICGHNYINIGNNCRFSKKLCNTKSSVIS